MKLIFQLFGLFLLTILGVSCVKNTPFMQSYAVPENYVYQSRDSSAKAQIIMTEALYNYLSTSATTTLTSNIADSLWANRGNPFTKDIAPNFLYSDSMLNRMNRISLLSATFQADSLKAFIDSTVSNSRFNNTVGSNGVAGWQTLPNNTKKIFSASGIVYEEVWMNAMLGALSLNKMRTQLSNLSAANSWDLAYDHIGFPENYDPTKNYTTPPIPKDRPLGIAASLNSLPDSLAIGAIIYEAFRKGKAAHAAQDTRVINESINSIYYYAEMSIAINAFNNLNSAITTNNNAAKLYHLSKAYGQIIALKNRIYTNFLTNEQYWSLRALFDKVNFYELINDPSANKIKEALVILSTAYSE